MKPRPLRRYEMAVCVLLGMFVLAIQVPAWRRVFSMNPLDSYAFSDLLINYEGGYLRRGLVGEGMLFVNRVSGWDLWTLGIGIFLFLMILSVAGYTWLVARSNIGALTVVVLFLSPLLFAFYAYDHYTFFRKDLFVVFSLVATALALTLGRMFFTPGNSIGVVVVMFISSGWLLTVLVVDFGLFFLPWLVVLFVLVASQLNGRLRIAYVALLVTPAALVGALTYLLDVRGVFVDRWNLAYQRALSETEVSEGAFWANYAGMTDQNLRFILDLNLAIPQIAFWGLALVFGPILLFALLRGHFGVNRWLVLTAFAPLIFLFIAFDWGRWLSLMSFAVVVLALALSASRGAPRESLEGSTYFALLPLVVLSTVIYVTSWRIPHCCVDENLLVVREPNLVTTLQGLVLGGESINSP